jgi:hypothetical protein
MSAKITCHYGELIAPNRLITFSSASTHLHEKSFVFPDSRINPELSNRSSRRSFILKRTEQQVRRRFCQVAASCNIMILRRKTVGFRASTFWRLLKPSDGSTVGAPDFAYVDPNFFEVRGLNPDLEQVCPDENLIFR